ncbi:hypothetical protein ABNF65_11530 [Paenibacillus larvae]
MGQKIAYTMRIDEDIYEKAKVVAETELRSVNNLIEYLLLQKIREFESNETKN